MKTDRRVLITYVSATALTVGASALFLGFTGVSDENLRLLLRLTARIAFVTLLLVFVARPLRQMLRTPFTLALLQNRPYVGLTFAGIHTGHLLLILHRAQLVPEFEFRIADNVFGALTYFVMFAMVVTTFRAPAQWIGPRAWQRLHKIGLYLLIVVFAQTQLPESLDSLSQMNWPLVVLLMAALVIRLTAYLALRSKPSNYGSN